MAENLNRKALLRQLAAKISEVYDSISKLERVMSGVRSVDDIDNDEEYDLEKLILLDRLDDAFAILSVLLELLGLNSTLSRLVQQNDALGARRGELKMAPWVGEFYNEWVGVLQRYENTLAAGLDVSSGDLSEELIARLRAVLRGAGQLTLAKGQMPKSEAEVTRALYGVLRLFFPDATTRGGIAQPSKTYVPDLGIPSLKVPIEVKFVADESDARKVLGELYEDMGGYAGSEDWSKPFALIYMTKPFLTAEQIDEEVGRTKPGTNWEIITVVGAGKRTEKKSRSDPKKRVMEKKRRLPAKRMTKL